MLSGPWDELPLETGLGCILVEHHSAASAQPWEGKAVGLPLKAIEMVGTIDKERRLHLDEPLPPVGPSRVRVIILIPEAADLNEQEWLQAAVTNPAFDYLKAPEEDIYTLADGKPFHDQG